MSFQTLFLGILPLILFVIIDTKFSAKSAILSSLALAALLNGYYFFVVGDWDATILIEMLFLAALGFVSLHQKDKKYFRLQPFFTGIAVAGYIFFCQIFFEPILLRIFSLAEKLDPKIFAKLHELPQMQTYLTSLSWQLGVVTLLHAFLCGFAAIKLSNSKWLLARLLIYPMILGLMWMTFPRTF